MWTVLLNIFDNTYCKIKMNLLNHKLNLCRQKYFKKWISRSSWIFYSLPLKFKDLENTSGFHTKTVIWQETVNIFFVLLIHTVLLIFLYMVARTIKNKTTEAHLFLCLMCQHRMCTRTTVIWRLYTSSELKRLFFHNHSFASHLSQPNSRSSALLQRCKVIRKI